MAIISRPHIWAVGIAESGSSWGSFQGFIYLYRFLSQNRINTNAPLK